MRRTNLLKGYHQEPFRAHQIKSCLLTLPTHGLNCVQFCLNSANITLNSLTVQQGKLFS